MFGHEYFSRTNIFYPSLVLVQPRKTCPCLTERLLMGRKESNQTNKNKELRSRYIDYIYTKTVFLHFIEPI